MDLPAQHPIYVVVSERLSAPYPLNSFGLPNIILAVIECDISDVQKVYDRHIGPLIAEGRIVQFTYYSREPESAFRHWREKQSERKEPPAFDYTSDDAWETGR